jgi:hypothetical protein
VKPKIPARDPTVRQALAGIEHVEARLREMVQDLEERYGVEVRAITLSKTASGNVRVQRTIAVRIEVAL